MFYEPSTWPAAQTLADRWESFREEYDRIAGDARPWVEPELFDNQWNVYGLYDFPNGDPFEEHCAACPATAEAVAECFPTHGAAGFSVLGPKTDVHPHVGYQGDYLRLHLPLRVPTGDSGLEVAGETRRWRVGEPLVFDDRVIHRAWNHTDELRVVLLVDFVPAS